MKFLALLLAGIIWLFLLSIIRIYLTFFYSFQSLENKVVADFKILFSHLKVEINIPKEMLAAGWQNIFSFFAEDISGDQEKGIVKKEQGTKSPEREHPDEEKRQRYKKLKNYQREVNKHYIFSVSRLIIFKRKLVRLYRDFYRKVNVYSLKAIVQVGGRDAAETGLIAGAFWALLGEMNARLHRLVTVKKNDIKYSVEPCFDEETFLCKLDCILSLRIGHIIFTANKFLLYIIKNRRIRNYGRAPD